MAADSDEFDPADAFEVPGTTEMVELDENDVPTGDTIALDEEYDEAFGVYCVASRNC